MSIFFAGAAAFIGRAVAGRVAGWAIKRIFGRGRRDDSGLGSAAAGLSRALSGPNPFGVKVEVRGDEELRAALCQMQRTLDRDVKGGLKEAAEVVAEGARARAPVRSGKLRDSIRPFARGSGSNIVAGVAVSARARDGYAYPKRLEYERSSRGRPFLEPAYRAHEAEFHRQAEGILDDLERTWASGSFRARL